MLDFLALELTEKPNQYLVCNETLCQKAQEIHRVAPVYDLPAQKLAEAFKAIALSQPRTKLLEEGSVGEGYGFEFVQRSFLMRFPDFVSVQVVPVSEASATLAIYSRSKYGYSDLGVNEKRITNWLELLEAEISGE